MTLAEADEISAYAARLYPTMNPEQIAYLARQIEPFEVSRAMEAIDWHRSLSEFFNPAAVMGILREDPASANARRKRAVEEVEKHIRAWKAENEKVSESEARIRAAADSLSPDEFTRYRCAAREEFPWLRSLARPRGFMSPATLVLIVGAARKLGHKFNPALEGITTS